MAQEQFKRKLTTILSADVADFTSVADAVQCAVATQKELHARNAELPENRRMHFRIGVNLGDVIEEESRIFGDGMAEQLIAGLSQSPDIYVTARTSSFAYKGKPMTAQQIADQLGVRYLLEAACNAMLIGCE